VSTDAIVDDINAHFTMSITELPATAATVQIMLSYMTETSNDWGTQ